MRDMSMKEYDLIVIGAGPGGYVAAERAGDQGLSVLLVEQAELGGVCTNEGCIPTKALLNAAKHLAHGKEADKYGVHFENPRFDLSEAMAWKNETVETLRNGIAFLMKKSKVEVVPGRAECPERGVVLAAGERYRYKNLIVATGSSAFVPPIPGADGPKVVTNREILQIEEIPQRLTIIGGGVIGIEFACFFSAIGTKVTVVEMLDEIIPLMDADFSKLMRRALPDVEFRLSAKVTGIDGGSVTFEQDGKTDHTEGDLVLMSVGRRPNTAGLEELGLDIGRQGIAVNETMQTNLPGVYAAGDVTGKSLLAHSASRMGEVAVDSITGGRQIMRYGAIPWAVYTFPEAAGCGLTEEEAAKAGHQVITGEAQMRANGRFLAEYGKRAPGLCKVVADAETGVLLGVHMLGDSCSEIIYGAAAMIEAELRIRDIKEIVFPHPSVSEIIKDAVWAMTHT